MSPLPTARLKFAHNHWFHFQFIELYLNHDNFLSSRVTGESFTITNHGKAIADLVPSAGARKKDKVAAAEKLKAFMRTDPVRGVNIKELIEEGRA